MSAGPASMTVKLMALERACAALEQVTGLLQQIANETRQDIAEMEQRLQRAKAAGALTVAERA